jgi:hypothetical protein
MSAALTAAVRIALVVLSLALATSASAQTLFTTSDYRQDRDRWTDPAYFNYYSAREVINLHRTGTAKRGSGADEKNIFTPYAFKTSWEHFQAWRQKAGGGTKHTVATLPDWDGHWQGDGGWLGGNIQVSTVAAALTPDYREYYVQQTKAEAEGRAWWPSAFCLPDGFIRGIQGAEQFVGRPAQVMVITSTLLQTETQIRWIYTDGREHPPEDEQYPRWMGESIGFWDGNALVVHTNQIRRWTAARSAMFEWSEQLSTVERYERMGDTIVGEITLYDPEAFLRPLHVRMRFTLNKNPRSGPAYNTCTDSDGPSTNVYVDEAGFLAQKVPGQPGYWNPNEPRPWAAHYALGEKGQKR